VATYHCGEVGVRLGLLGHDRVGRQAEGLEGAGGEGVAHPVHRRVGDPQGPARRRVGLRVPAQLTRHLLRDATAQVRASGD
jgi:hypothetical protein